MIDFKTLNESLKALDVIRALKLECRTLGQGYWRGRCPFHYSSSALSRSLAVSIAVKKWLCHKCGAHGDLIDLWAGVRHCSVYDAAKQMQVEFRVNAEQRRGTVNVCRVCKGTGVVSLTEAILADLDRLYPGQSGMAQMVRLPDESLVPEVPCFACKRRTPGV